MFLIYAGDNRAQCADAQAAGSVPYGVRLEDPHHGICWRYAHQLQLADLPETTARMTSPDIEGRQPHVPRPVAMPRPIY